MKTMRLIAPFSFLLRCYETIQNSPDPLRHKDATASSSTERIPESILLTLCTAVQKAQKGGCSWVRQACYMLRRIGLHLPSGRESVAIETPMPDPSRAAHVALEQQGWCVVMPPLSAIFAQWLFFSQFSIDW